MKESSISRDCVNTAVDLKSDPEQMVRMTPTRQRLRNPHPCGPAVSASGAAWGRVGVGSRGAKTRRWPEPLHSKGIEHLIYLKIRLPLLPSNSGSSI
jgi:hypothetical protein